MRQHRLPVQALGALALLLAACGGASEESPPAGDDADEVAPVDEGDDGDDATAPADLREFTDQAIEAAAEERGVAEEEIEVVRSEEVEWPDAVRGCPEEGEMYSQAVVPGYLVVLDVAGEERHYHGGEGEAPFHCEDPQSPTGG